MVVSNIFYFQPYLGKIPILTNGLKPPIDQSLKSRRCLALYFFHVYQFEKAIMFCLFQEMVANLLMNSVFEAEKH